MAVINWILDGEPIYTKSNVNFPRVDGSTNDITNRPLREVLQASAGLDPDANFPGFTPYKVATGTPEGVETSAPGKIFFDTVEGALYFKATGSGNTGWILIGGGVATSTELIQITPFYESWDIFPAVSQDISSRTSRFGKNSQVDAQVFFNSSVPFNGGTNTIVFNANAMLVRRLVPNPAGASHISVCGPLTGAPLSQKLAVQGAPAGGQRLYRRYTFESTVTFASLANFIFNIGFTGSSTAADPLQISTAVLGCALCVDSSVAGGAWQTIWRKTSGGGLTTGATGAVPVINTLYRIKLVYQEAATGATLSIYINDVLHETITETTLAINAPVSLTYAFGMNISVRSTAASSVSVDAYDSHYMIEDIVP